MSLKRNLFARSVALTLLGFSSTSLATQIQTPAFSCDSGPYAVVLPKHYPTLHVIGKHQWTDIETRSINKETMTTRRIEYIGMRADVSLSSVAPNAYKLLSLEVSSLRWNIGPLSVGQNPWKSVNDKAIRDANKNGTLEIVGTKDSVTLVLREGRIDKVSYRCPPARVG